MNRIKGRGTEHASPVHADEHKGHTAAEHAPAVQTGGVMDPDVKKTLGSINSRLVRTHKKVNAIYTRLTRLQKEYRSLLLQLKKMQIMLKKEVEAKKKEKAAAEAKKVRDGREDYLYRAAPFDPVHLDSYP